MLRAICRTFDKSSAAPLLTYKNNNKNKLLIRKILIMIFYHLKQHIIDHITFILSLNLIHLEDIEQNLKNPLIEE